MTAKGKINASKVQAGDRIIVKIHRNDAGLWTHTSESATKTGEGVQVARVLTKAYSPGQARRPGRYVIETTAGSFEAAPIQTMWLAPEDNAGIKRAYAEALDEDRRMIGGTASLGHAEYEAMAENVERGADPRQWATEGTEYPYRGGDEPLTLHSQDGKVSLMTNESDTTEIPAFHNDNRQDTPGEQVMTEPGWRVGTSIRTTEAPAFVAQGQDTEVMDAALVKLEDHTGSAVVRTLEKVWARIREDHPELPEVVIVTGSGMVGASKWGHFRADGWTARDGLSGTRKHELFLAGEALAKGARQVLQTMLHEGAHTLARVRGIQDTSRQGRWHNKLFKAMAEEMGLEHKGTTADKSLGWSCVTLKQTTADRYADLMAELEAEIRLTCHLPGWLGGTGGEADKGGERIGVAPKGQGETKPHSGSLKAECGCLEPNIIRASRKVLDLGVVRCDKCDNLFIAV